MKKSRYWLVLRSTSLCSIVPLQVCSYSNVHNNSIEVLQHNKN